MAKTKIITISNQKGGVGKTTTAVTLAHGLAIKGKSVLLLDLDPQGQVASILGQKSNRGMYLMLMMGPDGEKQVVKSQIKTSGRDRLWILPGNDEIAAAGRILVDKPMSYVKATLQQMFMSNGSAPDYIIIDTSPSKGGSQEQAIFASDYVLIPTAPEFLSLQGVAKILDMLKVLVDTQGWQGKLAGVLPTLYDEQTRESMAASDEMQQRYGQHGLLLKPIHRATVMRDCAAEGMTIFERDPDSRAAKEYQSVVDVVSRLP